jgi:7-cyano-7-deazaguanine synthase
MRRAVVLLSGGVDSATTLAIAKAEGYETYAISFDYGQRHRVELEYARKIAESLGVKKHLCITINLRDIGGSALTDTIDVPKAPGSDMPGEGTPGSGSEAGQIPITYVPARNTIFLSLALGWAERLEASAIFIGVTAVDYSGYPDCRQEFITAFEAMANLATRASVEQALHFRVHTPLIRLSKADIIRKGKELGLDYSLTWSCYDPQPDGQGYRPCGTCDSCRYRNKGFRDAGATDSEASPPGASD